MWRTFASLMLTMAAFAWAILASAVCFFYSSAFWRDTLGRFGAFWGALTAFTISLVGARLLLALADKLLEQYSGPFDRSVYAGSPRDTFYHNWRRYADEIVRNRRIAFYARTGQWDRLSALQAEAATAALAGPDRPPVDPEREALLPHRLSMEPTLPHEEVARAARRGAYPVPHLAAASRWAFADDD
jgi:hypothetical protein